METVSLYFSLVLVVGMIAQWLAWRLHLPAILVLLAAGFALGQYQSPNDIEGLSSTVLFSVISLSVAVILFEGGLTLRFREMSDTGRALVQLIIVGALLTWGLSAVFAHWVLELSWTMSSILGSILVVTGPTVIGPLLRHVRPSGRVAALAKWEGIVIDPVGAVLAVLVVNAVISQGVESATWETIRSILLTIVVGTAIGWIAARFLVELLKRHWVPDYLDNCISLAIVFVTFAVSNLIQKESGLLTVTVFGLVLANQSSTPIRHLVEFKETLRVLLISVLFIVLSSRIRIDDLTSLSWNAVVFVLALVLVVRPISVLVSTIGTGLKLKERLFLSWLAPRGIVAAAVSSVFAIELAHLAHSGEISGDLAEEAKLLSPLVFVVIVGTVSIYGLTARWVARKLGVGDPHATGVLFVGADSFTVDMALILKSLDVPVLLVDSNYQKAANARMQGLRAVNELITVENVEEELDLRGIGHLLAMTANDQVNSLAMIQLSEVFDRSEQFQLVPMARSGSQEDGVASHLTARRLFHEKATWEYLTNRHNEGAIVKKTPITADFDADAYRALYGEGAVPLFVYNAATKRIKICEAGKTATLEPGRILVSLIDPPDSDDKPEG